MKSFLQKMVVVSVMAFSLSGCVVTSVMTPHESSCSKGGCCGLMCVQRSSATENIQSAPAASGSTPLTTESVDTKVTAMLLPLPFVGVNVTM